MSREKVIKFISDLPKSPKDMAERFKKIPFSHKLFGVVTTAALAACAVEKKIGIVTPTPEGTATNPPPTEITPTATAENQTVFGSGEFISGDPSLSDTLKNSLREGFNIEIPQEATVPFSLKVGEAKFDFVSLSPLENTELGISWNEKLFIKVNDTLADLDRQQITIDGNNLVMWSYLNPNNNQMEPVLWYPALTTEQWESLTSEQKSNFYAGFAPPSPLEGQIPGYTRTLDQVFTIAFGELPENALKVRASLKPFIPIPESLSNLPEGLVPVRNSDGTWGIGINREGQTVAIPDVSFDSTGLHVAGRIDVKLEDIAKRLKVGQNSPFQIYNEEGNTILYAYDAENRVLINSADVLQPDNSNLENYIHVQTWEDLQELFRKEKMVLPPFSADTHSWLSDKIILNYEDHSINRNPSEDYTYWRPLGVLEDLDKSPFRFISYSLLEKGEERPVDIYIMTVQVYNPDDGSFSVMHYANDWIGRDKFVDHVSSFSPDEYLLPDYQFIPNAVSYRTLRPLIGFLFDHGYLEIDGGLPKIKALVDQWLSSGHVPPELENIPLVYSSKSFKR